MSGPKLCIFDELMSASTELSLANKELKALSRLKKFVVGLIGQGDSQGAWLWAMTQSPQVADLGMSGGVRANLRAIGLVSPKNMAAVEALTSTKLIPPPPGGMDELRAIMAASPVGRAVFDGKLARWLPMPKLQNHSGFDRDNRSISSTPSPIASPAPIASLSSEERKAEIARMKANIERLQELNEASHDERIQAGIDYEMHDSFDPPRDRLERLWEGPNAIEVVPVEPTKAHPLADKFDRIESLLESDGTITVKELQTKLKISTSIEAQQLAQMFCINQKSRYKFASKPNPNGTTSYLIQAIT